ncbi:hypothetical protein EV715DRAFT_202667 [Schizophyllum commune]
MDDPHDSPASSGSKTFGIHKYNPGYCLGSGAQRENKQRGYEGKYEDDALYEELGDDARIWRVMLDEGRVNDAAMLQRFRDHLDVDLVFAGLFSAVVTTFVVQTSQTPPKTGDTTIALLLEIIAIQRAWANDPRVDDVASFSPPPPSPSPSPWINRCWFLSLIFSLLAAFGAVVVRQWLQEYESDIAGPPKRRALVRHFRRVGLKDYKVNLIVPILPMLLHVSLLLFFVGLTLYVRQSDRSMSNGIIALTVIIYLVYLGTNILPIFRPHCPYRSPLSTGALWVKSLITLFYALLPARPDTQLLPALLLHYLSAMTSLIKALARSWKKVFRTPDAYEWETVQDSSETLIPNSLDSVAQASSDLSVAPLVMQASSSLPIKPIHHNGNDLIDPRYCELLRYRVLPWFTNALRTRRMVFDWAPGRENELQRMACALLLIPLDRTVVSAKTVLWKEIDTAHYRACVSRVLQALTSALLDLTNTPTVTATDVATMSMTLFALDDQLRSLGSKSNFLQNALGSIATVYSSLSELPSLAVMRLHPVIWLRSSLYLGLRWKPAHDTAHLAITLWRSAFALFAVRHILCPSTCESHKACVDGNAAFDDNLGFLVVQFTGLLLANLAYDSIDSALRTIEHSAVSAAFESTFLVRPALSLAQFLKPDECLPATLAVSLFWLLAKLAKATVGKDSKVAVLKVLNRHATDYCEAVAEVLDYDKASIELLLNLVSEVLHNPQMALLDISDALAASLATQLSEPSHSAISDLSADVMIRCLYLDALCAARAHTAHISSKFPDASRKLHSALLSLKPPTHNTLKSQLIEVLKTPYHIPFTVALALRSTHGRAALAEWVDDLPTLMQDPGSGLQVWALDKAREGEGLNWYRLFTSDPDKHIRAPRQYMIPELHISDLVSFEVAVERMQKTNPGRAAAKRQRGSHGDGAEVDANNDAQIPGCEHGLDGQGGAERTQNEIKDRLETLGRWMATSFKGVPSFLGTIDRATIRVLPADASG